MSHIKDKPKVTKYLYGFCVLAGVIPILISVSFFILSSVASRETAVAQYNAAVQEWKTYESGQFTGAHFDANSPSSAFNRPLLPVTGLDAIKDSRHQDFVKYSSLTYKASEVIATRQQLTSIISSKVNGSSITYQMSIDNTSPSNYYSSVGDIQLQYQYTKTSDELGKCDDNCNVDDNLCKDVPPCDQLCPGSYDAYRQICTLYLSLQSICILVKPTISGLFDVVGVTGSSPADYTRAFNSNATGCYYETARSKVGIPSNFIGNYTADPISTITVEIRHWKDPYVLASRLTYGTYNFGQTQQQLRNTGIAFILPGILWIGFVYAFTVYMIGRSERPPKRNNINGIDISASVAINPPVDSVIVPSSSSVQSSAPILSNYNGDQITANSQPNSYYQAANSYQQPSPAYIDGPQSNTADAVPTAPNLPFTEDAPPPYSE